MDELILSSKDNSELKLLEESFEEKSKEIVLKDVADENKSIEKKFDSSESKAKFSDKRKATPLTVPCEIKMYIEDFNKSETIITSIPNPAWKEAASQLERGKLQFFYSEKLR